MTSSSLVERLDRDVLEVARWLVGCILRTTVGGQATAIRLTEVEAYAGDLDPASHAFRGRTARNEAMFGPPGTLYVYRSYGIHWCANVVVREVGIAHAVLMRAGIPTAGRDVMKLRRGREDHLTDGPGKLCQALGITGDHDGTSLVDGPVRLSATRIGPGEVAATRRIGITKAVDRPWRFVAG